VARARAIAPAAAGLLKRIGSEVEKTSGDAAL